MNTALDDLTNFEIVDRTGGHHDAREMLDDVHHSTYDGRAIAATVGHTARIGRVDVDVLTDLMNRDYHDMVEPGMPSDTPGQTRKYVVADLERIVRTPRFKALMRERQRAEAAHERQLARRQKAEREAAAKQKAAFDAEVSLIPNVYELLVSKIVELEAEIAALRR